MRDASRGLAVQASSWQADAAVGFIIAVVAIFLVARMGDPVGARLDSWSDAEVIISGIGYTNTGFFAHAGLAQHQIGPPVDPYFLYANYPVLSNMICGVLHKAGAERLYRLPAVLTSLLALWLWYRLVTRVVDQPTGLAATAALASSFAFLGLADNIHQQAYPLAPQLGALCCFAIAVAAETTRPRKWLLGCALCLLLVALLTIELHLWLMIALCGYALLFGSSWRRRWVLLLALPLCIGLGLQWMQNRVGSPIPAAERPGFMQSLYRRSIGFAEAVDTPLDARGATVSLTTYPRFMAQRFGEFYGLPWWLLPPLLFVACAGRAARTWRYREWPAQMKLLLLFLAAGLGWMLTMMQQTAVHAASLRQLLPFYALLLGVVWIRGVRAVFGRGSLIWRCVIVIAALGTLVAQLQALAAHRQAAQAGREESRGLGRLHALPEHSIILTNYSRVPLIRYWSRRPAYYAPFAVSPDGAPGRSWLELDVSYLRTLYPDGLPRLVYLYRVARDTPESVQQALAADPLLRILTTGRDQPLASPEEGRRAALAFSGDGPSTCPVILRGMDWRCFDMTPIMPQLLATFSRYPAPTVKDMPAPR